ncbi:ABC transporter ATP-binding protein [Pelagibius sp.]|uniref:ABC transporter ATP-binding protein n=1 Tax=Pelagibius sp. TaxID=1931238 RepID=UPI0026251636|nr:oligopeptide/dipeptide ABC transporter ATP-binding protein [Pelagibius sp.]
MAATTNGTGARVLEVTDLDTRFSTPDGEVHAVNSVSFGIDEGESVGVVGESGSGKTQIFLSIMGLLAKNGGASGSVRYRGQEILGLPARELNKIRGVTMSMIFQDPMTSLNPFLRISKQMTEVLVEHKGMTEDQARARGIELLDRVGIPGAKARFDLYPHEFSGGMRQRVMIAMALLCEPDLLIADEPTTALDVTIQAQILELMADLKRDFRTAIIMITHDLGVVAGLCDRVMVMYAGRVVEKGAVRDIYYRPQHPYSLGLLSSMPRLDQAGATQLNTIPGQPPNLQALPEGCAYQDRCPFVFDACRIDEPGLHRIEAGREKACHLEALPDRRAGAPDASSEAASSQTAVQEGQP